jgi:DNA integrity scanning protein DisA with diadenylate cyclase activity
LAIVVSEESGQISYINNGAFIIYKNTQELIEKLEAELA